MINISPCFDPDYPFKEVTNDRADYYLRKGEAPGRWTGDGARALGLAGEVTPAALRTLFCGKHPNTGVYLASARGSSARAGARSSGRDLEVGAAAARLGLPADKVRTLLRTGELAGEKRRTGTWRVATDALDAYEQGRPQPSALGNLPAPAPDNTYSLAEAARLAGVSRSYLARIIAEAAPDTTTREDGRLIQYLVGRRDDQDRWRVAADELDRFMARRVSARVVPAYDVAVRPPKSVSILHALGALVPPEVLAARGLPRDLAGEVLAAHHAAVDDAIAVLERHAAWIRGPGGRVQAVVLTIAAFDHRSSRMGDPLLHTHLVVANVARGVDGRTAAVDGTALYAWARPAGFVYQARLRAELTKRLGVEFHQPHNGVADLVGVPRAVIDCFSQRSAQRDALLAALGRSGPGAAQGAVLASRPAKGVHAHQSPEQLAHRWHHHASHRPGPARRGTPAGLGRGARARRPRLLRQRHRPRHPRRALPRRRPDDRRPPRRRRRAGRALPLGQLPRRHPARPQRATPNPHALITRSLRPSPAEVNVDRKSTRLNSSHIQKSRMPSSA